MSPDELRAVIGANIRSAAKTRRLGLSVVADLADVSRTQMFDVLAGRKACTSDWLAKVAEVLHVEPHSLLMNRSDAPQPKRRRSR